MTDHINGIKMAVAAIAGALTGLWGWMGWLVVAWVVLMALDYATGTAAALKGGSWSSRAAREGIWHKTGEVVVVLVAALGDTVLATVVEQLPVVELSLPQTGLLVPLVLVWYALTELGSIVENAAAMGAPIPGWLLKLLALGKDAVDGAGNGLGGGAS